MCLIFIPLLQRPVIYFLTHTDLSKNEKTSAFRIPHSAFRIPHLNFKLLILLFFPLLLSAQLPSFKQPVAIVNGVEQDIYTGNYINAIADCQPITVTHIGVIVNDDPVNAASVQFIIEFHDGIQLYDPGQTD